MNEPTTDPRIQVGRCLVKGAGLSAAVLRRADRVELDWDVRQKSRFDARSAAGRLLAVFLPRGTLVRGGDVLVTEDGSLISVVAAPQAVMEVRPCPEHGDVADLVRAAYHLGNRHVPVDIREDSLRFEPDHVLADMLRGMHFVVSAVDAPFEPEAGAYHSHSSAAHAGHQHGHGNGPHGA
jgi:urease accessory protein